VSRLHPEIEPSAHGMLETGDGNAIYWETCGSEDGKPALVVHGGPGSGCTPWHRRLFDPAAYRIVLFDQRNCGRSRPHAADPATSLAANTTPHLIADMELLREHLAIDRWLLLGGSWGSTLALAYAEAHRDRVSEVVLFGVTTDRRSEADWLFREGLAPMFPEQWARRREAVPDAFRGDDIVESYRRMLESGDPEIRELAAYEWCMWESVTPAWPPREGLSPRFEDAEFRMAFARLVTHYIANDGFIDDDAVFRDIELVANIPAVLINGRYDLQAPLGTAWELARRWPSAELVVVGDAGHAATPPIADEIVRATDRFASGRPTSIR
jgi:proline iminopeptidase